MTTRYDGPPLDGTVQHISEAPYWNNKGETVDVIDDEPAGEETTENVPDPISDDRGPSGSGQATLDDYGWSP